VLGVADRRSNGLIKYIRRRPVKKGVEAVVTCGYGAAF
jgi:hypothetical protein